MTARLFSCWFAASVAVTSAAALAGAHPAAATPPSMRPVEVGHAVKADESPPLRSIRPRPPPAAAAAPAIRHREQNQPFPIAPLSVDPVQQLQAPTASAPAALTSWDGISNINGSVPPDTEGDVGPNDYVQWVNLSFAVWSKTGTLLYGPVAGNTIWSGFGGVCETDNQGDPVVVYDRLADRWVFTQFGFSGSGSTGPYFMCMAVSTTGDPTGPYFRYAFPINTSSGDFPDYPKVGVWPDGYYMSTNNFSGSAFAGAGAYVFDRAKMLTGDAAANTDFASFQLPIQYEGLLPASVSGPTSPPAGSPDYFGSVDTSSSMGTGDKFQIWKLHADFATPASSTLAGPTDVPVAAYTWSFCGQLHPTGCIPQPSTHRTLDPLADRLMFRLQYRNFGDHETLVASHNVNVGSSGADRAGERWYEIRSPGGSPVVTQQGTFAPADSINRWMGSAAMDGNGDIALGYSASAASATFPSVFYTGRLAGDPAGTMTLGEGSLATGAGSQTGISRWGDYSAMSVDPTDDLTLWYTQEYYSTSSSSGWKTRIGSFRLASVPTVTLTNPANGSFTNNVTPTFSGTAGTAAADSSTVTVNVYGGTGVGGTPVQTRTATIAPDGTWSATASPALAPGTYTARAQQSDTSGDTGYSSANTFTVDTTAPAVTLTAPANGSSTNVTTPTFSGAAGTATGDSPTVTVKVYSGSAASGTPVQTRTATVSAGSWSISASPPLTEGTYTAQAAQTDAAGNIGTGTATFTIDTTAPVVTLTAPVNGSSTNAATPTFSGAAGTATGDSTTVTVKVYSGSAASGTPVQTRTATVSAGSWSVSASPALAEGTYTARAQQSDAAGNVGTSAANTFIVDTTPPVVTLTAPANGSFTNNTTPTFSGAAGTATGDSTSVTVKVYSGSAASGTPVQTRTATVSAGSWSVSASPALAEGTYTARAQQSDAAGNAGTSTPNTFSVDTTAPVVTLTSPAGGTSIETATPAFSGAAGTAPGDSTTVTVKVYSGSAATGTPVQTRIATVSAGSWSVSASPALAPGSYTAQAQQSDAAGNVGTSAQPPTFTVLAEQPPVASFTFAPPQPLVGQAIFFDGSPSSDPDGAIAAWSWDFGDGSPLGAVSQPMHAYAAAGGYPVSLTVTDDDGNVGSVAETVTVIAPVGSPSVNAPSQQPPATPQASPANPTTPPLKAYLRVPKQALGTALARGVTLQLGANAAARATLRVTVGGAAARLLRRGAASRTKSQRFVIGQLQVTLAKPGIVGEVIRLRHRTVRLLRTAGRVPMSFQLVVVDYTGRSTTLSTHVVLSA